MSGIISPRADLSIIIDIELLIKTSVGKLQPISQTLLPRSEKNKEQAGWLSEIMEKFDGLQASLYCWLVLYILDIPV